MRGLALTVCLALTPLAAAQIGLPGARLPQLPAVGLPNLPAALPPESAGEATVGELDSKPPARAARLAHSRAAAPSQ